MIRLLACVLLLLTATAAYADDKPTVSSPLKDGYEIRAAIPSNAGPGLVLEKSAEVLMCFVAETPGSADIATQYCKPVH